jgi:hypothetical protein
MLGCRHAATIPLGVDRRLGLGCSMIVQEKVIKRNVVYRVRDFGLFKEEEGNALPAGLARRGRFLFSGMHEN